jgi:hypothetical protein
MKKVQLILFISSLIMLQGCATIIRGTEQKVLVKTEPVSGATCELTNNRGKWHVTGTPQSVAIQKSIGDLKVICIKEGYLQEELIVASKGKPMLMGGFVGVGVDAATGAGFKYPEEVLLILKKKGN